MDKIKENSRSSSGRLTKNVSALTIIQISNYIVPLLVARHLISVLGLEFYGVLAFALGLGTFFMVIADVGFSIAGSENISRHHNDNIFISKYVSAAVLIKALFAFLAALIILLYAFNTAKYAEYFELFLLVILSSFIQAFIPTWFFIGKGEASQLAYVSIIGKAIYVLLIYIMIVDQSDIMSVPILISCSALFTLSVTWWMIRKKGIIFTNPTRKFIKNIFVETLPYYYSRLGVATYMNIGLIFLGLMVNPVIVGAYAIAEQLYKVMQSAFTPVTQAIFPYMVREKDLNMFSKIALGVISLAIIFSVIGYFVSPVLVPLIFGDEAIASLPILNIFFIAIVAHIITVFLGFPLFAILGRVNLANITISVGPIFYIIGLIIFYMLDLFDPIYLALLMVISELAILTFRAKVASPLIINFYRKKV
tara:strand:- start:3323 stop:4588 length:1266 start_codon:yes stop_codon:yes gene_type:complete